MTQRDTKIVGKSYSPGPPSQRCLSHIGQLGCVYRSCDHNRNKKVTLQDWMTCLVDQTEAWFHSFMC
ncbi:hypothetical protein D4764_11G0004030 [Takifugu flavidus]|uniref:Uncharacterized protein n=1 Tax=Takifugu flavidus TaxID=433684 RepID=A0A5C6PEU5_9TELE|nr:hypothetical protein D4764_11G0004030 [Takifugu flavidus]